MSLVITLGASAGGLAALESFFKSVPDKTGCSFVIVQHLSPDFKSLMSQLLTAYTKIPILLVEDGMELCPDHIYLIPAGTLMSIQEGVFRLRPRNSEEMPINVFMCSAATCYHSDAIGIILSGTGTDGTKGCEMLRNEGGLVLAQSPDTAEFGSMPQSIISHKLSHAVAPADSMWPLISQYDGDALKFSPDAGQKTEYPTAMVEELNIGYSELFAFLKRLYEIDFSSYKITSVSRRITRRMELLAIPRITEYLQHLEANTDEAEALYRDLLIGVTTFFRDKEIYDELSENVIEPAFTGEHPPSDFRIWVAGCASGEEAYSMAILTDELARKYDYTGHISIFATDIHKSSVQRAGQGIYTQQEVANLSEERLGRYFRVTEDGRFKIKAELRQRVVFAQHNLLIDPPFTRMDLVTCRNLLIYLKPEAQESVLQAFHYALRLNSYLLLGASESLGDLESAFRTISSRGKIFRKQSELRARARPAQLYAKMERNHTNITPNIAPSASSTVSIDRNLLQAYDLILKRYAPTGVLITRDREVRHYFGAATDYCMPADGRADSDFLSMLRGDIKLAVSTTLQRVLSDNQALRSAGISCTTRHGDEVIDVTVAPYIEEDRDLGLYLVTFEPREKAKAQPVTDSESDSCRDSNSDHSSENFRVDEETHSRILMLEDELRSAKENLQATVEELQTSNEELQAINEEVQVSNEELQSTNEELHSMNEELYTVNSELEQTNHQLIELNSDHENLLSSTEDAVLYVDKDLRIKKFNSAITFAFNLLPQDIGRPIEHIAYNLENRDDMLKDVREVMENGCRKEREESTQQGISYLRRLTPFIDGNDDINGVILTFTDITEVNQMRSRLSRAMETAKMAWWEWDIEADQLDVHAEGECILGYDCDNMQPSSAYWFERVHPDDLQFVRDSLNECIEGSKDDWVCEHRYLDPDKQYQWVYEVGRVCRRSTTGLALEMTGTTMNIHARKTMELDLKQAKETAENALLAKAHFLSTMSHEIRTPLNGVCGMAELLKLEVEDGELSQYVDTIKTSANVLLELINGILDYSKAESGLLKLIKKPEHLQEIADEIIKITSASKLHKSLDIRHECLLQHDYYLVDAMRIKQILINLIGNAIKFTPDGGHIKIKTESLEPGIVKFTVSDEGIGIAPEFLGEIFNPFTQQDDSDTRKYGGTGLGLSICRQLVELMGGAIEVNSEIGKGTRFTFTIHADIVQHGMKEASVDPMQRIAESVVPIKEATMNIQTPRALIVDDDLANRIVMKRMLEKYNMSVETADGGPAAFAQLSDNEFQIIFMDLQMPGESGYEITQKIRSESVYTVHGNTPIIAFTADASLEAKERIKSSGFDGVLIKPVTLALVKETLDRFLKTK